MIWIACLSVPDLPLAAQAALVNVARAFSPRVSLGLVDEPHAPGAPGGGGEVFLDAAGLERLYPSPDRLGAALVRAAMRVGLAVRVGLGPGVWTARLAAASASADQPVRVVAPGQERAFLAPLPISLQESSAKLRAALERFGLERLGQLAALPAAGLGRRLGPEGLRLWRLARGEERRPLVGDRLPERFVEEVEPDWSIDRIEPLLGVLDGLIERLIERLVCRGLSARALCLTLGLDPAGRDERSIEPAAACARPATWRELLRRCLEQRPPPGPVVAITLEAQPVQLRGGQQDFFDRAGVVASAKLDESLAQLAALAGQERVGSAWLLDEHHPDALRVEPLGRGGGPPGSPGEPAPIPLRALRPPVAARVLLSGQRPASISVRAAAAERLGGRVVRAAGPWRIEGGWWRAEPLSRDYYDVELASGSLVRLYCDRQTEQWFIDGICG